tara:strand:+ start:1175 stop:3043 length:1869 start_codon:yes stop_codon:yes gene_type:complete
MAEQRDIKYLNKDFDSFRARLVDYTKTYFPNTYNDFTEASPGMMFMEMASYVGDVLAFYMDNQIQENFVQYAREQNNLLTLSYMMGYTPKVTSAANVDLSFYQILPATATYTPDFSYALSIPENTQVSSNADNITSFLTETRLDFSLSSSLDPTEISVYSVTGTNPAYFLLRKTRRAISSTINTVLNSVTAPTDFYTINLEASNIIGILDIIDSDGNTWYEVPYLAEEMVYDSIRNTNPNDPNFINDTDAAYLLKTKQVARRFITRFTSANNLQIQFGAGTSSDITEEIIPNPTNVGIGLPFEKNRLTTAYSPTNFIFSNTYGIAPANTTLTIRYLTGGGVASNVQANQLTGLDRSNVTFVNNNIADSTIATTIINGTTTQGGLNCTNLIAATGGSDGDSISELRLNTLSQFSSQLRNVTQDDYLVRAYSMPSKYGSLAKVFVEKPRLAVTSNQSVLDMYVLSYNVDNNLQLASTALKQNLQTYLYQYKMVGDSLNIKDGFIINIGVNFEIIVLPNYNNNRVLLSCINFLKRSFNINNWQINQPIILNSLFVGLDKIEGVQTVKYITINNKVGTASNGNSYSSYAYDVEGATLNNVVYPSIDPMIFEVKFPNSDIQGKVVQL